MNLEDIVNNVHRPLETETDVESVGLDEHG